MLQNLAQESVEILTGLELDKKKTVKLYILNDEKLVLDCK
jgi:hypothetical protein